MNETIEKFGYPATLLHELDHWVILLRPAQPTLGSLVLAAKSDAVDFSALPPESFGELRQATGLIESALSRFVDYSKINYLMLMMVDPHVHYHVIPRYSGTREFAGTTFADAGWPKMPDLAAAVALDAERIETIKGELGTLFED